MLVERDPELAAIDAALAGARTGDGAVLLVEGVAGIGKTALLDEARRRAAEEEMIVLRAVASELDRDFPFGLVHQLVEPLLAVADEERRAQLLAGAAARAEVVFAPASELTPDPGYAVLHGLYWLVANLAQDAPVVLSVDDLHWADRASLRLFEYVGRRLDGLGVVVAATVRSGEAGDGDELLDALRAGESTRIVRPGPLSETATAAVLAADLDAPPDPAFTAACAAATGGNPLLVRLVAREGADRGLRGSADDAEHVAELGAAGVRGRVQRRLRALGEDGVAVAGAAAVLGERRRLDDLVPLGGLDEDRTRAAVDRLVATAILEPSLAFVHPVVREAVAAATGPAQREELHARAAAQLAARGAPPAQVAVHLLACAPAGEVQTVRTLRDAARAAAAKGAPDAAVTHLRRALAEPPAAGAPVAAVLLELGELEARAGAPEALERLATALDAGLAGDAAARAHAARASLLLGSHPQDAAAELARGVQEAADPALGLRLEGLLLDATAYHGSLDDRRRELLRAGREDPGASPVMLAHLAQDAAYTGASVEETLALADRALAGGELLRTIGPESGTVNLLVLTMRHAERADRALELLDAGEAHARRLGSRSAAFPLDHARAYWHLMFGSVAAGEAHARAGLATALEAGLTLSVASFRAILVELLVESDRLGEAAEEIAAVEIGPGLDATIAGPDIIAADALVRWRQGHRDDAEVGFRRARAALAARGWRTPLKGRTGLRLAEVLGELAAAGRPEARAEALAVADGEIAVARGAGTAGATAAGLRVRARLHGGEDAVADLREAVALLDGSPMRLERAWALHDLGARLRRDGRRADARDPLREALDLAERCGSRLLVRLVRDELAAAGSRPRRSALSGPESLTPSERRVADLAAEGLSNREIAEALWVTRKTVELHLSNAYGKLGIRSRTQLPQALSPAS